jgi:phosphatidylserine/phosphatidylglycerophosphate/cardiolipin synthase-like enzyme
MRFAEHSAGDLAHVAAALFDGRLTAPFSAVSLARLGVSNPPGLAAELAGLAQAGFQSKQISMVLDAVIGERRAHEGAAVELELVVTGPDVRERARDTAVVVEQLFTEAKASVLVVGFALYDGNLVFRRLAERLDAIPELKATLCLDISRRGTDTTKDIDLIARYAHEFRQRHWSGNRLPNFYFDPRGLMIDAKGRAVLHAKCIVVDGQTALVTSANPTPAAYTRNIELGVVVRGGPIPAQIVSHFSSLISTGVLRRLDLLAREHGLP